MELFLTPASISFLAQTILFLIVTLFLAFKSSRSVAIYWLAGFYSVFVFASLASFISVSSLEWFSLGWLIHNALILVALPLLLQFVYNFPNSKPERKKEAALVSIVSIVFTLYGLITTIVHVFSTPIFDLYPLMARSIQVLQMIELAWAAGVLISLTIHAMGKQKENWFKRLQRPKGRASRAARGFSFSLFGMLLFWLASFVFEILGYRNIAFFAFTTCTTWALIIFMITLINQTNHRGGILVKLIGLILVTSFTGITFSAWFSAPVTTANFQAAYSIPDRQTYHFEQNNAMFSITQVDFNYEEQLGRQLIYEPEQPFSSVKLLTSFAFAGENWEQIEVSPKGFIRFGEENQTSILNTRLPSIAAFYVEDLVSNDQGGVFAHITEEKSTITWYLAPRQEDPSASITSQIILYPDGSFDITYNGIHTNFNYNPYNIIKFQQISGFFMGENDPKPTRIQFNTQLPFVSEAWNGVYQDYYVDFREYLHQNMSMQLYALLFTILLLIIIMPIFFQRSFVIPINTLKQGFQQVMNGDLETWLEPNYNDDIGQVIMEFNQMLEFLTKKQSQSQETINELREKLIQRNTELKQSVEKLAKEIEVRKIIQENLDTCRQATSQLAIRDDLTTCYNRAHVLALTEEEIKRAKRYNTRLSFAIIDPDYLRMINETYGTLTGDEVLKSLAKTLQGILRETDTLGRVGGEEFAVLMPQTSGEEALQAANRWRNKIGSSVMETSKGALRISISVGVIELPKEGIASVDMIFHHANQALDTAKEKGRNTAVLWNQTLDQS